MADLLNDIPETCNQLKICKSLVYKLIIQGLLPTVKFGKRRLVPQSSIDELVKFRLSVSGTLPHNRSSGDD